MCLWQVRLALALCATALCAQRTTGHRERASGGRASDRSRSLEYSLNPVKATGKRTYNAAADASRAGQVNRRHDVYETSETWWRREVSVAERRKLHLEYLMHRILAQTGLDGPVNMSGVVVPETPMLEFLINEVKVQFADQLTPVDEDLPQGDDAVLSSERTFFVAKAGPDWLKMSEEVIYFNVSHQQSSALSTATVNFWLRPLKLRPGRGSDKRKQSRKKKSHKEAKPRKKSRSKSRKGNHGRQQNRTHQPSEITVIIRKVDLSYANGIPAKRMERVYKEIKSANKGGWIRLEITDIVEEWLSLPDTNFGITVTTKTTGSQPMVISGLEENPNQVPVLELEHVQASSDRSKRFANNRVCSTNRESVCCRDELIVDFIDLHWDFIVAPKKYEANLCRGDCPFLYAQQYPHSALVQKIFNVTDARFGACCGAREMDPLIMIYYDGQAIKVSTIRDMVVKQCGCS